MSPGARSTLSPAPAAPPGQTSTHRPASSSAGRRRGGSTRRLEAHRRPRPTLRHAASRDVERRGRVRPDGPLHATGLRTRPGLPREDRQGKLRQDASCRAHSAAPSARRRKQTARTSATSGAGYDTLGRVPLDGGRRHSAPSASLGYLGRPRRVLAATVRLTLACPRLRGSTRTTPTDRTSGVALRRAAAAAYAFLTRTAAHRTARSPAARRRNPPRRPRFSRASIDPAALAATARPTRACW